MNSRTTAAMGAMALLATFLPAQVPQREVPRPQEFTQSQDDNLFSLPRSQEDIHSWEQALEELAEGKYPVAVERLHRLLQTEIGGVASVAANRYLSLRLCTLLVMANFPPAASAAYETLVKREAGSLLRRPVPELPPEVLQILAERYPASEPGRQARLRLGDLCLEAGDGNGAIGHFRQALDAAPIGSTLESKVADRLRAAAVVQRPGDWRHHKRPEPGSAQGDVLGALPAENDEPGWPWYAGGSGGRTPMVDPIGTPRSQWSEEVSAPGFEIDGGPWAMHATGDLSAIYVATGVRLLAFDPLRKTRLWESPAPLEQASSDLPSAMRQYQGGSINQDMVLAAAYGADVVVAALQVPETSNNVQFRNAFHIMSKIPERRLFAFQRATGKLLWSHFDKLGGPVDRRFRGHSVCAPPMVVGNVVYVPTHDRSGAIAFYLSAYDLNDGKLIWRRLVCSSQQEVNMFGNARSEFAASPLCLQDGVFYGSSNLGVVYAVDQCNGRLRWVHAYEVTPLPPTQFHGQQDRPVYFANNAPAVTGGVMACTPIDSMFALGIDAETGTGLWKMPFPARANGNNDVRWLVGTIDNEAGAEFVFAGAGVVAVRARPKGSAAEVRQLARREFLNDHNQIRNQLPRPAASAEFLYFPSFGRLSIFDHDGNMAPHNGTIRLAQPGNVLLVDGMLVCLKDGMIDFQYDPEALLLRAEARLRTDDSDPAAILRLATLRRALQTDRSSPDELYRRGLAAADKRGLPADHPVRTALLQELFDSTYSRAQQLKDATLLRSARDMAPSAAAWIGAQLQLIALLDKDAKAQDAELRLLAERHGSQRHTFAEVGNLPVRAWVLWQLARRQDDAATAVAAWQELLEQYPDEQIGGSPANELCRAAITRFLEQRGQKVYAAVETRAKAALEQAGTNVDKLRSVAARFPHSEAATAARRRLMDAAVERGDLGAASEMLAQALASGEPAPGILRRTIAAASTAGNKALARHLATRLRATAADAKSDYPADRGRTFGEVATELLQAEANDAAAEAVAVPEETLMRIPPRAAHTSYRLPAVMRPEGFPSEATPPVYVLHQELLLAFDPAREKAEPLFQLKVSFLETLVLCGHVLVVPDLSAVSGHDHRTGAKLWELPNPAQRIYECLGVQGGILHLTAQTSAADAPLEVFGVEPLTGKVLFRREFDPRRFPTNPKGAGGQLLLLEAEPSKLPVIHRLDPLTGLPAASITLKELDQLGVRPEALGMSRVGPQLLCADQDRIYLPIDGTVTNGAPCIGAFDGNGKLVWHWTGSRGRRILMAGLRGDRMVIVEAGARGSDKAGGKIAVLHTKDGLVVRELELGDSVQLPLNWHRSWLPEPAPPLLLLTDRTADKSATRRLIAMALDDALPSFQQPLAADDGEGIGTPVLGQGFLTFAVKPVPRGPLRLYSVQLADRRGAFSNGRKLQQVPATGPYEMTAAGPYTVISAAEGLILLGQPRKNR